ncbi:MAG: 2-C-methyl-D-erythritol 2,4-cyclodiphosphate synthase [Planctomycetes bacterium ADurb.Bin412]|nr:MAG: 2-C-methyl-D-erythritol 2,4-cyclodiphosphate synthase [Planctomycetes bacterium ADurb.Bin412]
MSIDRIGQGYDLHRLGPGGRLILAGIQIPSDKGLIGHSDADVLFHAVIDALLGAAGLPDIGQQFPDTDPAYKGIDSGQLLQRTLALINEQGYTPVNVDATILAERPKLQDYKRKMRENLAKLLHLDVNAVNIKAKTNEGLGEIGSGQAIACQAVAALRKNQ